MESLGPAFPQGLLDGNSPGQHWTNKCLQDVIPYHVMWLKGHEQFWTNAKILAILSYLQNNGSAWIRPSVQQLSWLSEDHAQDTSPMTL